jgi:hypothetical protein
MERHPGKSLSTGQDLKTGGNLKKNCFKRMKIEPGRNPYQLFLWCLERSFIRDPFEKPLFRD